jgi:hypothetical protein
MLPNTNRVEVQLNYGELSHIIQWCERNCSGSFAYEIVDNPGDLPGEYEFYFETNFDYVNFILWKK